MKKIFVNLTGINQRPVICIFQNTKVGPKEVQFKQVSLIVHCMYKVQKQEILPIYIHFVPSHKLGSIIFKEELHVYTFVYKIKTTELTERFVFHVVIHI